MASPSDAFDRRNLLTYASLLLGVAGVAAASVRQAHLAGFAIAAAVIADTFDGRFARRFGAEPRRSALGVELDSLADAIAFGIAPPLCAVLLLNVEMGALAAALWGAAFVHAACAVTRLASYNLGAMDEALGRGGPGPPRPPGGGGFVGIPVPLAALFWSSALLLQPSPGATVALLLAAAAAMVLPLRVPRPEGAGLVLFTCWPVAVALLHAVRLATRP